MILGISGKKQTGKDTVCVIIKAIDIYYNTSRAIETETLQEFIKSCLDDARLARLKLFRDIVSKWEKRAYADKLKQALGVILGVHPSLFEDNDFKLNNSGISKPEGGLYTNRELLQKFGTEVGRNISPNIWVDALFGEYVSKSFWVIPDVRFPSEALAIKERKGIVIRLDRDTGYNDIHLSETSLDNYDGFDYRIDNNNSIDLLISTIETIMREQSLI